MKGGGGADISSSDTQGGNSQGGGGFLGLGDIYDRLVQDSQGVFSSLIYWINGKYFASQSLGGSSIPAPNQPWFYMSANGFVPAQSSASAMKKGDFFNPNTPFDSSENVVPAVVVETESTHESQNSVHEESQNSPYTPFTPIPAEFLQISPPFPLPNASTEDYYLQLEYGYTAESHTHTQYGTARYTVIPATGGTRQMQPFICSREMDVDNSAADAKAYNGCTLITNTLRLY